MSFHGLLGAIAFLVLGIIELAVLQRVLYPVLRSRHERAKLTQTHGIEPNRIMTLIKLQGLVMMPVLGLYLGEPLKAMFG